MKDISTTVYAQDHERIGSHGWVQWKGTDVCMDTHCDNCGHHGHIDAGFFYLWQCPSCGARYAVGQVVKMILLTDEQAAYLAGEFQTGW